MRTRKGFRKESEQPKKYFYKYFAYTDNLCYGRVMIACSTSKVECDILARWENKGAYVIEKHRVYYKKR